MYGWIWRHLPGPTPLRCLVALGLVAAVVVVLFTWVFPWVEHLLPFTDVTVEGSPVPWFSTEFSTGWGWTTPL